MDEDVPQCAGLGWIGMLLLHSEGVISHLKMLIYWRVNSAFSMAYAYSECKSSYSYRCMIP